MDDIVSKLTRIEEDLGYSPKEMSELGKCSLSSYHRYRSGKSIPRLDFLWHLANNEQRIRTEWLLRDSEPRYIFTRDEIKNNSDNAINHDDEEICFIPFYRLFSSNEADQQSIQYKELSDLKANFPLGSEFVNDILQAEATNLFMLRINVHMYFPVFPRDSTMIFEENFSKSLYDSYYLIRTNGTYRIKWIEKAPNNKLNLYHPSSQHIGSSLEISDENIDEILMARAIWLGQHIS